MARLVCLANSIREGDRCVAGIDLDTGEWVRPVPAGGGGIPYSQTCIRGQPVAVLDVLEIDFAAKTPLTEFQRENRMMKKKIWKRLVHLAPKSILKYCDNSSPVLHNRSDRVSSNVLKRLPPEEWASLQLVRPRKTRFTRDSWNRNRWRASFQDRRGNRYSLKVTDPVASGRLNHDEEIGSDCILTVSLTEPWAPNDSTPEQCYKLVAAVIEL